MHRPKPQKIWHVITETVANWNKHNATTHSAALAYLSLFSLAPVVILAVAVAGWAFGAEAAQGELGRELGRFIGPESAKVVQDLVAATARPRTNRLTAIIGTVTLLVTATGALMQLQDSLNTIWEVTPKPGFFLKQLLKKRLICLLLILGVGVVLLASLAASAGIAYLQGILESRLEVGLSNLVGAADVVLSWILMTLLIGMVYRILPDVRLSWRDVAWGSGVTAVLFLIGKYAIGFYLRHAPVASSYGAAGSVVLILIWVYYSTLIFLLGAEFTRVHSRRYREGRAVPEPGAVRTATVTVPVATHPAQSSEAQSSEAQSSPAQTSPAPSPPVPAETPH